VLKVHFSLCNPCTCLVKHKLFHYFLENCELSIFFNLSIGSQRTATKKPSKTFLKFVKVPNIFYFVTHLKYPKTRTYVHLEKMGSAWECGNGRSQLLARGISQSKFLQNWHTKILLRRGGRYNLNFGNILGEAERNCLLFTD